MKYSESSLVDYRDDEVAETARNAGVDHVIQVVSVVERRMSRDMNKSPAADGYDDSKQARTVAPGAAVSDARAGVNKDAVIVATERASKYNSAILEFSRNVRGNAIENSEVHLS